MENNGQPRFCPSCGSPIIAGKGFCPQCGTKIILEQAKPVQNVNPYAQTQSAQNTNPYAQAQPTQNANPYAQTQSAQNVNPYAQTQPTQNTNPYAQSQPTQSANPYAQSQTTQNANPYAQTQSTQNTNPYAQTQTTQNANPYAQTQSTQNTNPYAQTQPTQNTNPYAQTQSAQNTNPYAQAQPTQNTNPYAQANSGVVGSYENPNVSNEFSQESNPYAYNNITASENLTVPKKRSKKPFIIAGVSVVGVAAIAVAGVFVFNMFKPSGGPLTKIADSAKNLAKANSATVSASVDANGNKASFDISYEIDASKKEVVLVMNGTSESSLSSYSNSQNIKAIIYCKDGIHRSAMTSGDSETVYSEIDEETLNSFFDSLNKTNVSEKPDWNELLEEANLSDYVDSTQIDAVSDALLNTFENGAGKEALGIEESSVSNGTKYSFNVDAYKTLSVMVDEIEPLFKDKTQYNNLKNQLPQTESYLNSIKLKFDITVDNAGYFSGFSFNSFGVNIDLAISNVGNTKVSLSDSEINEIKNADTSSIPNCLPDDYDTINDWAEDA